MHVQTDHWFTRARYLKRLMLTHTGDKQHVCPECGKRSARGSYLKRQHVCQEAHANSYRRRTTCMSIMWLEVAASVKPQCP